MSGDEGTLAIRSYGLCFAHERRIHQVDRWRIPVPYGVPLSGIGYAALALLCVLMLGSVPVIGAALGLLHPALRLVILPVGVAYGLCRLCVDGRSAHAAALSWLHYQASPRWVASCRSIQAPGAIAVADIAVSPDERSARYRPGVLRGPARVVLRGPATATRSGQAIRLSPAGGPPMWRGKRLTLRAGQRLVVR